MRKIAGLTFLLIAALAVAQPKINFREGSLTDILKMAADEKKPVMLMGYATWCTHCNVMKTTVLADPNVAHFYSKNFICMWADAEKGEGIAIRKRYNVKAFPAFLFLDKTGELLYTASGEIKTDDFIKEGQNALNPAMQLPTLKARFEADVSNAENCLAYISALRKSNQDAEPTAKKYLSRLTDEELISNMNWKIMANGIRDINSREFQYILKKQPEFAKVSSQKRVDRKIINAVQEWLHPFVEATDTVSYFRKRLDASKIGLFKTDSLIFNYDLQIFEKTKNWNRYQKAASAGVNWFAWKQATMLKEIARVYMNNIHEPKTLDDAIAWGKRSLELHDAYDTRLIIAKLYFYRNDMKNAKEWAENAKSMAESYNFDTQQAVDILNQIKS